MKKIMVLAGLAAAAYGAMKVFRGSKEQDEFSGPADSYPEMGS